MRKKQKSAVENETVYLHTRGVIKDNAVMALLGDKLFRQRVYFFQAEDGIRDCA